MKKKAKPAPKTKAERALQLQRNKEELNRGAEKAGDMVTYQANYYRARAEELRQLKRDRYKNDPAYRESVKKQANKYYKEQKLKERVARKKMEPFRNNDARVTSRCCPTCGRVLPSPPKPKLLVVAKKYEVLMYTIGDLAKKVGRQPRTITLWLSDKYLPESIYRDSAQRRLWTHDQVLTIVRVCSMYRLRPPLNFVACGFVGKLKAELEKLGPMGIDVSLYALPGEKRPGLLRRDDTSPINLEDIRRGRTKTNKGSDQGTAA